MIEKAVYARLAGDAAITAIVGTAIYPQHAPQGKAPPYIVYQRVSTERQKSLDGPGLVTARIQIDCDSDSYAQVKQLADAVRQNLSGYRGYASMFFIQACWLEDERDSFEPPQHGDEAVVHRVSLDFMISYNEG